jgi:polysaccharide biosynthesis/export protein
VTTHLPGLRAIGAIALLLVATGCRTTGEYVAVDDLPSPAVATEKEYVIQPGDTLSIKVWGQEGMSTRAKVRPDGRISIPFVNDVQAGGSTPGALAAKLQASLRDFLVNPVVTVTLEEPRPLLVSVLGEVARPGAFALEQGAGVLQAIAMAGGMTPFASKDSIMVIRQASSGGSPQRIRFSYDSLVQLRGRAATFRLQGGDVVVVE